MTETLALDQVGVVIADDQEDVRGVVREILEQEGFASIFDAQDGVDCVQLMKEHAGNVRLLVLDLGMPRMSGLQVIETLSHVHMHPLGILIISNEANLEVFFANKVPASHHIRIDHLQKPFHMDEFRRRVQTLLATMMKLSETRAHGGSVRSELDTLCTEVWSIFERMREVARLIPNEAEVHSNLTSLGVACHNLAKASQQIDESADLDHPDAAGSQLPVQKLVKADPPQN